MRKRDQRHLSALTALMAVFLCVVPALAQEQTGSIEGLVEDSDGAALPGVVFTLSGDSIPSGLTAVTNDRGTYRFPAVPPGTYTLKGELSGFKPIEVQDVRVTLGARLQANFEMPLDTVEETIEVTSEAPIISFRASDSSATINKEWVDKLPVGRDFTSVVSQAAGANDEDDLLGGISIDGSSGAENRFFVDAMDTTNLQTGVSEKRVITDFVEEVQVKYGGYNAEYGGSTGGVISVVTKTGGNAFRGDVHGYYDSNDFAGDVRPSLQRVGSQAEYRTFDDDDDSRFEPGFTLGGPILKDKLWFFAAYSPAFNDSTRTVTFTNGTTNSFDREDDFRYGIANVTTSLGPVFLKASANWSDAERNNILPSQNGTGSSNPDDYDVDREQPNRSVSANLDWLPSNRFSVNVRGGHFQYDTQDTGFFTGIWTGFSTTSAGRPGELFPDFPANLDRPLGNITADNQGNLFDKFDRDVLMGDLTYFLEGGKGDHEIKFGGLVEEIGNDVLNGYTNTRLLFYWGIPVTDLTGELHQGQYGYYRALQIATQGKVTAQNSALFVQDSWRVNGRLTLNLGLRGERENIPSYANREDIPDTAIGFDYSDKIAPRLGFSYDVRGDGKWKAYGSYGVFYDNTKLEMPRGLFGGDKWVDWFFALDTFDWESIAASCHIESNTLSAGPPPGCPGEFFFAADRRHPANDPNDPTIEPNLKPLESNEATIGVEHLLGRNMSIGLRYVHKELKRTIEDSGIVVPGVGEVFFISNPGEGIATNILGPDFPSQPRPTRDYDGLTVTFRKNFSNNWGLNANYTYSKLFGNYSGLASSDEDGRLSPNVNRFFDSLNGSFDANTQPVFGRLATDRPHQFKTQLIYTAKWGTTFGVDQRIASGTPVSTEYTVSPGLPFFPYGRGDMGRTPTFTQTDLFLAHDFNIGDRYGVQVNFSIFNLFDEDTPIDIYYRGNLSDLPLNEEEFFAGFDPEQVIDSNGIARDPRYGLAEQFQARRSMRFGIRFSFR